MKDPLASAFVQPAGGAEEPAPAHPGHSLPEIAGPSRVERALARLHDTRQALRQELMPAPEAAGADGSADPGSGLSLQRLWRRLRRWSRDWAPLSVLVAALEQTWRVHPLRPAGEAISEAYQSQVAPVLRKHPWAAVAVAAGLGALLMLGRRWHGPLLASTLRPLPQRLGRWLLLQLTSAPVQTALAGWLMMRAAKPADPRQAEATPPASSSAATEPARP
jgi:hypothetical protein